MEVYQAIMGRRSVRRYKSDPVDEETLKKLLEAARQAPSWANTQCCRLVVVKDQETKARLADTMWNFTGRGNSTADGMKVAPLAVAFCAQLSCSGYTYAEPRKPATDKGEYWYMYDVALAMENFALAAYSFGLGTVIVGAFDALKAAEVLKVPAGYAVVTLTPLGYPAESPNPRPRKEITETVFLNQFGAKM